jgi:uracil-DNA glycosylase
MMGNNTILFVGSNPSTSSTEDAAFHSSTMSSKRLMSWLKNIDGSFIYINVFNSPTENNRPLKKSEIVLNVDRLKNDVEAIKPTKIVALGKTASTALEIIGAEHYKMPHPSGRNREINDEEYIKEKVKGLENYVSRPYNSDSGSHEPSSL